jgi:predicted nucleotidyltransferase
MLKKLKVLSVKQAEKKKYEMVLDLKFRTMSPETREKISKKLEFYQIKGDHLYLHVEQEDLISNIKKNLILII